MRQTHRHLCLLVWFNVKNKQIILKVTSTRDKRYNFAIIFNQSRTHSVTIRDVGEAYQVETEASGSKTEVFKLMAEARRGVRSVRQDRVLARKRWDRGVSRVCVWDDSTFFCSLLSQICPPLLESCAALATSRHVTPSPVNVNVNIY